MGDQIAQTLLSAGAVQLRPDNPFTFASGIKSPIYCDNRLLLGNPDARTRIIDAFLQTLAALDFDVIAGTATAGIPWAAILADRLGKPLVYVRSAAKDHGRQNRIEGYLPQGAHTLVIEDLISTGRSAISAVHALAEAGATTTDCVAIFTYGFSHTSFTAENCTLHTLTNLTSLLKISTLPGDKKALVARWQKDPENWQ